MRSDGKAKSYSSDGENKIEHHIHENIMKYYHDSDEINERLEEINKEWDVERTLELSAALAGITGTVLGLSTDRKWLILPIAASVFLIQQAMHGWCPPLPLFRWLGVRTRKEIDKEKYALKAVRGDFKYLLDVPNVVWKAVNK
ncbi:MAG: hypothetical protein ACTHJ5_05430 [Ilyomonas sp.]